MAVYEVTKENYALEVQQAQTPVLIDFWASWCGPCKMLSPVVDEIAEEQSQVKICKINVDEQPELASAFQVMSIPTLVYLKNGEVVGQSVGVRPKAEILKMLNA